MQPRTFPWNAQLNTSILSSFFSNVYGHVFLSVRKLKNQPSNKLLLALFFIQTLRKEIFVNKSHINLLFLSLGPVPRDSILCQSWSKF